MTDRQYHITLTIVAVGSILYGLWKMGVLG